MLFFENSVHSTKLIQDVAGSPFGATLGSMLDQLAPRGIGIFETYDSSIAGDLFEEEEQAVVNAVESRVDEFRLGRNCARKALEHIGAPQRAIPVGKSRAPVWPNGVIGSITHTGFYCAAAVGWRSEFGGIGIDAADNRPLPTDILEQVTSRAERVWVQKHLRSAQGHHLAADSLIFSIKESIYKAWNPITGQWLGFEDAFVVVDAGAKTFVAELNKQAVGFPTRVTGEFTYDESTIVSSIFLKL